MENKPLSYKPSVYYFRLELRAARSKAEAVSIGEKAIGELELLKAWIRSQGIVPPRWLATRSEIEAKGLAEVIPFPRSGAQVQLDLGLDQTSPFSDPEFWPPA